MNINDADVLKIYALWITLIVLAMIQCTSATTGTNIIGNEPLCFLEHLNPQSSMSVRYILPNIGSSGHPSSVLITITDPVGNEVFSQERSQSEVSVSYTAPATQQGQYLICLLAKIPSFYTITGSKAYRIEVQIDVDDDSKHYAKLESKDRLDQLNGLLEKLKDKLSFIEKEQRYFKDREERFRVTSDTIASRIVLYGGGIMCIMLALGTWQVYTMRSFFRTKKLV